MNISDLPLHHLSTTLKDHQAFDLANSFLLKPNGLSVSDLDRLFGVMHAHRLDDADIYFQHTRSEQWSLEEGIVKSGSFNIDQGWECVLSQEIKQPLPTRMLLAQKHC
jgi:TldD protein